MKNIQYIAQKGIILNKSKTKILVIKYLQSNYLPEKLTNKFGLPGGKIKFGHDHDQSFIQEVKEETGISITPSIPFYIWNWKYKRNDEKVHMTALARLAFYKSGEIQEPAGEVETKISKAQWILLNKLEINKFVFDEQPAVKYFLKYQKTNPFKI